MATEKGAKPAARKKSPAPAKDKQLTAMENLFVLEYLVDLNAERAALAAGYSATMAKSKAYQWVGQGKAKPHVKAAVDAAMAKRSKKVEVTAEMVLDRYWQIATADPNSLMIHRRVCCRHCFGKSHYYQWVDEREHANAVKMAALQDPPQPAPSKRGGFGYNCRTRPHPLCPKCGGEGHGDVLWGDTRGNILYAGLKQTKQGFEIRTHDQLEALGMVARHLGMLNDKLKLTGDEENPMFVLLSQLQGKVLKPVEEESQ